jgi:hypothetical protein
VFLLDEQINFREVPVDWSAIPSLGELENFLGLTYEARPLSVPVAAYAPAIAGEPYPDVPALAYYPFKFEKDDYLKHDTNITDDVIDLYEESGFDTGLVLEDPFGHQGPTVACPIGFPFNLPKRWPELNRFNRWICRLHVDITYLPQNGSLVSVPHIEPDPAFHMLTHLWDTYIRGKLIRGKPAVQILMWFLGM